MADSKLKQIKQLAKEMVQCQEEPLRMLIQCQISDIVNRLEADLDNIYLESRNQSERVSNLMFK